MPRRTLFLWLVLVLAGALGVEPLRAQEAAGTRRLDVIAEELRRARTERVEDVAELGAEAIRLLSRTPDAGFEQTLRLDLSWWASRNGDTAAALAHARRGLALAQERDDRMGAAWAEYHVALAHWYRQEHDEALAASERARVAQLAGEQLEELGRTLTLKGAILRSMGRFGESLEAHFEALEIDLDEATLARLDQIWPGPGGQAPEAYAW